MITEGTQIVLNSVAGISEDNTSTKWTKKNGKHSIIQTFNYTKLNG